ncbi:MAG: hypothetical protein E7359_03320 [Clostridiales bacterium]|nr:hypothetical protein [Clostridiales bacterium]
MKNLGIIFLSILICVFVIGCFCFDKNKSSNISSADYLRLHIRANSNNEDDQKVKYLVKSEVLNFINSDAQTFTSKITIENYFKEKEKTLENYINNVLLENGFGYISNITLTSEYFPTRTYNGVTLESGIYDAIIIKLGKAEGNNWWCVAYPPLCFMYESSNFGNITYKSKVLEIINKFFKR